MTSRANPDPQASSPDPSPEVEDAVLTEIRKALRGIEFGSIVIKIHQGKVVGIETSTKLRLDS